MYAAIRGIAGRASEHKGPPDETDTAKLARLEGFIKAQANVIEIPEDQISGMLIDSLIEAAEYRRNNNQRPSAAWRQEYNRLINEAIIHALNNWGNIHAADFRSSGDAADFVRGEGRVSRLMGQELTCSAEIGRTMRSSVRADESGPSHVISAGGVVSGGGGGHSAIATRFSSSQGTYFHGSAAASPSFVGSGSPLGISSSWTIPGAEQFASVHQPTAHSPEGGWSYPPGLSADTSPRAFGAHLPRPPSMLPSPLGAAASSHAPLRHQGQFASAHHPTTSSHLTSVSFPTSPSAATAPSSGIAQPGIWQPTSSTVAGSPSTTDVTGSDHGGGVWGGVAWGDSGSGGGGHSAMATRFSSSQGTHLHGSAAASPSFVGSGSPLGISSSWTIPGAEQFASVHQPTAHSPEGVWSYPLGLSADTSPRAFGTHLPRPPFPSPLSAAASSHAPLRHQGQFASAHHPTTSSHVTSVSFPTSPSAATAPSSSIAQPGIWQPTGSTVAGSPGTTGVTVSDHGGVGLEGPGSPYGHNVGLGYGVLSVASLPKTASAVWRPWSVADMSVTMAGLSLPNGVILGPMPLYNANTAQLIAMTINIAKARSAALELPTFFHAGGGNAFGHWVQLSLTQPGGVLALSDPAGTPSRLLMQLLESVGLRPTVKIGLLQTMIGDCGSVVQYNIRAAAGVYPGPEMPLALNQFAFVAASDSSQDAMPNNFLVLRSSSAESAPTASFTFGSVFNGINSLANRALGTYLKHWFYHNEVAQLKSLLTQYNIVHMSVDEALTPRGFRAVARAMHPDKGGSKDDFVLAQSLKEKLESDVDLKSLADSRIQLCQPKLHKATVVLKAADIAVDSVRLSQVPTLHNAKQVAVSSLHLCAMHSGIRHFSVAASTLSVAQTYYEGGIYPAVQQASLAIAYMAVPAVLAAASPPLAVAYSAGLSVYTGYQVVSNAYELYQSWNDAEHQLESLTAYRDNAQWLHDATGAEFLKAKVQDYDAQINAMKCVSENPGSYTPSSSDSAELWPSHAHPTSQAVHNITINGDLLNVT